MKDFKDMQFEISRDTDRGLCHCACGRQDKQLNTYDYLYDVPGNEEDTDLVEVQFKNTRKGYYHNVNHLDLRKGDIVAVEASPGHDIGVVSLTGRLVKLQVKKANLKSADDIKRIYRIAKPVDMDKYYEAKDREHATMIQSREIAKNLGLQMKIGDVEYQGDGNKAIFYYIADERVDFRQLIKVLADTFHVRIEMKQIGARQEAGRIGGTGPCGRELCCATWMKNFVSVSTNAARIQDISLNPQKLAGMCAKLKCCLNYEVDDYVEAGRKMPARDVVLETLDSDYYLFKSDILAGLATYSTGKGVAANLVTITAERARAIIEMNKRGESRSRLQRTESREKAISTLTSLPTPISVASTRARRTRRKRTRSRVSRLTMPHALPTRTLSSRQQRAMLSQRRKTHSSQRATTLSQRQRMVSSLRARTVSNRDATITVTTATTTVSAQDRKVSAATITDRAARTDLVMRMVCAARTALVVRTASCETMLRPSRLLPSNLSNSLLHSSRSNKTQPEMKVKITRLLAYMAAMTAVVVMAACNGGMVYDRYTNTPVSGWEKNDTLYYCVPAVKSGGTYAANLGLRTTDSYPFTSLTLIVEQRKVAADKAVTVVTDTVACQLTDRKGNAAGKGISYHQYQFPVTKLTLQDGDSLFVSIRHDMKREILPGISDVGFSLTRTK